jgi:hypothetical protein
MNNFTNNSAKFNDRKGLYCVWVPLHNDGKAPLISIWIDPTMAAFDPRQNNGELAGISEATTSEEIEDHLECIAQMGGSAGNPCLRDELTGSRWVLEHSEAEHGKRRCGHIISRQPIKALASSPAQFVSLGPKFCEHFTHNSIGKYA